MSESANDPAEHREVQKEGAADDSVVNNATNESNEAVAEQRERRPLVFGKHAFIILAVPFIIYLVGITVAGYLDQQRLNPHENEHLPPETIQKLAEEAEGKERWYPISYTVAISITALAVAFVFRGYFRVPFQASWLSVGVGIIGIVLWIALWWLDKNFLGLGATVSGFVGGRKAFNPFHEMSDNPTWMYTFLAIRFFGLVIIVPIVEEFFLRGFLMRYIDDPDWDEIPLGEAGRLALIGIVVYALVTHPAEPLAAVVWFGLVTWMYLRTKSIWDCVIAHAVTNLLLGVFVLKTEIWELW